jgi:hypothetical protein
MMLGNSSIKTTEIYLGVQQDLADAPCEKFPEYRWVLLNKPLLLRISIMPRVSTVQHGKILL